MASTSMISGLASGIDWATIIDQLIEVDRKRVKVLDDRQTGFESKLKAWQDFNKKLLSLQSSAGKLKNDTGFNIFTTSAASSSSSVSAGDILTLSTTNSANPGTYSIVVSNLAQAKKITGSSSTATDTALGYSGEFLINGRVVNVASTDTLSNIRDKINNANSGSNASKVTATILTISDTSHKLILSSDATGADGFDLLDASSSNVLQNLGLTTSSTSIKNSITNGAGSDEFTSSTTTIKSLYGLTSPQSGSITIDGISVSIDLSTATLTTTKDSINNDASLQAAGISATIASSTEDDGTTKYQLQITDTDGAVSFTDANNVLQTLGILKGATANQLTAGEDAALTVDGIAITRESNTISDAIDGVTLNLTGESSSTTITVSINRDLEKVKSNINKFVTDYNQIIQYINEQFQYDAEKKEAKGVLMGDTTLLSVLSDIRSIVAGTVTGLPSTLNLLSSAGLSFDSKGNLTVNDSTLASKLSSDFNAVKRLFVAEGTGSVGTLTYILHSKYTQPGTYDISVTTAATQASTTGSVDLDTALSSNDTLTITDKLTSWAANVSLSSGDTISTIVSKINTELATEYARTRTSATANTTDGTTPITANTTWSSIYGATVNDGDTINISGKDKNGSNFSGTYTISTASSDTVQDLLNKIREVSSYTVSASVNSAGKIVVADGQTGPSQMEMTLTPSSTGLSLGTFSVTGTDGRGKIEITASDNGSGYLTLAHNNYGSANGFTLSSTTQLGLTTGSINSGVDAVASINGVSETGNGQTITWDESGQDFHGLSVKYTGTSTGSIGSLTLTLGVGEMIARRLEFLTASDGYVTARQNNLQKNIDSLDDRMKELDERLTKQRERLINQFVAMENAMSKMQNISSWLSQQLGSISSLK